MENVPAEMGHVVNVHILHCVLIDMDILQCMTDSMLVYLYNVCRDLRTLHANTAQKELW